TIHYSHLGVSIQIGYNLRSEVTSEITTGNGSGQAPPPFTNQYGGLPTGNESSPSNEALATPSSVLSVPSRTATYVYDRAGNRTSQTIDGATTNFTYDAASRLTLEDDSNSTVEHVYDGLGNEVERTR